MQRAYIKALYDIMQNDKRVVSLLSDSGTDFDSMLAEEMPEQCFNFGIAEENQVGIAAGMALCGMIPFTYAPGPFLTFRSNEFIRNDVCYQNQNVKLIGLGSGLSWSTLGPSHHTTEDISALRALPNLTIYSPATPLELSACVRWAYEKQGPVYIRMGMNGEAEYFTNESILSPYTDPVLTHGDTAMLLVTGSILCEAMTAAQLLENAGMPITVVDVHTLKPLNSAIIENAAHFKHVCTLEEHNVIGGLGGIIAEGLLARLRPLQTFGLSDRLQQDMVHEQEEPKRTLPREHRSGIFKFIET